MSTTTLSPTATPSGPQNFAVAPIPPCPTTHASHMCSQTALPVRQTSTLERDARINHIPAAKSSFHWWQAKSGRTQRQHGPHRVHPKSGEGGQNLCTTQHVMHVVLYRSCSHFFCVLLVLEDLNVPAGTTHNTQLCGLLSYALFLGNNHVLQDGQILSTSAQHNQRSIYTYRRQPHTVSKKVWLAGISGMVVW